MKEELLQEKLKNINLCINKIISVKQGYEFLAMLSTDATRIRNELRKIEEEKWKKIFGEEV